MRKMMLMTLAGIGLAASSAFATVSTDMTCADAKTLVQTEGAVVLYYESTTTGNWLYDRFVSHGGYCMHGEKAEPAWIPTSDSTKCFVGYTCKYDDHEND